MALYTPPSIRAGDTLTDLDNTQYVVAIVTRSRDNTVLAVDAYKADDAGVMMAFDPARITPDVGEGRWCVISDEELNPSPVEHPDYYGGKDDPYEVIKVAEAWGLDQDAYLFNVTKYIARAGKKNHGTRLEDLKKARFYLDRRINKIEEGQ